jgi:hypothetical protein
MRRDGYVVAMVNFYFGSLSYIEHIFTAQAMYGFLANTKPAWISLCLYMDAVGLLVSMPRYNCGSSMIYLDTPFFSMV